MHVNSISNLQPLGQMMTSRTRPGAWRIMCMTAVLSLSLALACPARVRADEVCCTDLEDRLVELETTAVRKGNRRLSLTINGQANHTIYGFDDGDENNAYVATNLNTGSRLRFFGSARISPYWTAGYHMSLNIWPGDSLGQNQNNPDAIFLETLNIRETYWSLQSSKLGQLKVGLTGTATDNFLSGTTSGVVAATFSNLLLGASIAFRNSTSGVLTGITPFNLAPILDNMRSNAVSYSTPPFNGLTLRAGFSGDDYWDVAAYYAGALGDFDVKARVGYDKDTEGIYGTPVAPVSENVKGLLSARHKPSGLFAEVSHVTRFYDGVDGGPSSPNLHYTYGRAGILKRFSTLGKTSVFGELAGAEGGLVGGVSPGYTAARGLGRTTDITKADLTRWGFGVMQYIDAASTEMYVGYHNYDIDLETTAGPVATDDINIVYAGTIVRF